MRRRRRHGLLRRQHRHRAVELRPALRDERQLVRDDVRAVGAGRDQPRLRRHRQRRHDAHGQQPVGLDLDRRPDTDITPDGKGGFSLDERRPAVLGRLLDPRRRRDERARTSATCSTRRGLSWGWFQGGFRPTTTFADGGRAPDRPRRPVDGDVHPRRVQGQLHRQGHVPPARRTRRSATRCTRSAFGASLSASRRAISTATRTTTSRTTSRSSTTRRRRTRTTSRPERRTASDTLGGLSEIGTDTQSYVNGHAAVRHAEPPVRHERLRPARRRRSTPARCRRRRSRPSASSRRPATRTAMPPTRTRPTSRRSSSTDQRARAVARLGEHRGDRQLRRLRRLVRPRLRAGHEPVALGRGQPHEHGVRHDAADDAGVRAVLARTGHQAAAKPLAGEQGRCGFGPRLPMLVISPWAKRTTSTTT